MSREPVIKDKIIQVRVADADREYLKRLAKHRRITVTDMLLSPFLKKAKP